MYIRLHVGRIGRRQRRLLLCGLAAVAVAGASIAALPDAGASVPGGAINWGTGEIENMTNSTQNVFQDGVGHLVIKPIRDGSGNWTSGRVETQRTDLAAPAGGKLRLEALLQQPNVSGAAATPARGSSSGTAPAGAHQQWSLRPDT
jgi:hypothetical protein